jgi:hypothetical protein
VRRIEQVVVATVLGKAEGVSLVIRHHSYANISAGNRHLFMFQNVYELLPPETVEGMMFRVSLLFRNCEDLDRATLDSLTKAYEAACDELATEHYFTTSQLAGLIDEMADAIRDLYRAGQRSQAKLTHHAVTCALLSVEKCDTH